MKLLALDGNSLVNRAFFGIRPLTTKDGLNTNAIFGFLSTLERLLNEEQPDALCVCFDVHAPTFRHVNDETYKATRKGMPEELAEQMPVLKEVLDALSIPRYELEGWEADDLLGTISRKCEAAGWDCVLVTGDKDALQLITPHTRVKLVSTRMGKTTTRDMTEEAFREKYGFDPIHMIDLKALMGDSSDNIPGVPGIGEKTALELLHQIPSIDALYRALPDGVAIKPGALKKLTEGEESARHSYWLATIVTDAPLDFAPEGNMRKAPTDAAYPLFVRLEFLRLIERWGLRPGEEKNAATAETPEESFVRVGAAGVAEGMALLARLRSAAQVALYGSGPDGIALAWREGEQLCTAELTKEGFSGSFEALLRMLLAPDIKKSVHGLKAFLHIFSSLLPEDYDADAAFTFDTELAAWLLDAASGKYDLPRLHAAYCGRELPTDDAAARACAVLKLTEILAPLLEEQQMTALLKQIELPLCTVLYEMERRGCLVDPEALAAFGASLGTDIAALENEIFTLAGQTFNINSPKQLGELLFDTLKLPHGKKTKTGWSTNAEVLESLRYESPLVGKILDYRQLTKLKSTYADGLLPHIASDGRIHTSFQMTATATGRLSSTEPNLQNIPTRTELGSEIRRMFLPSPGNVYVDADYSQIELRLLAHISGDQAMCEAFRSGYDIHRATAAQVFHIAPEEVTPEMRRSAKAVNFGIVYGISAFSLSKDIGVSVADAKAYMEAYFRTFPGVRAYMDRIVEEAKAQGYVETLYHRRRALPELKSSNFNLRAFGERVALNMPIQGTAADIIKLAMIAVRSRLKREGLSGQLVLQVHDELIVECPESEAEKCRAILEEEMERVAALSVPLTAEAHIGKNWLDAKG